MAFVEKCGRVWRVKHGTNGLILYSFRGRNAEERARECMRKLHRKYDPLTANRGVNSKRRLGRCGI